MTILRLPAVTQKTGLSKARVYRLEREGRFPARVELGPNSVGWYEHEVDEWAANRSRRLPGRDHPSQAVAPQS